MPRAYCQGRGFETLHQIYVLSSFFVCSLLAIEDLEERGSWFLGAVVLDSVYKRLTTMICV